MTIGVGGPYLWGFGEPFTPITREYENRIYSHYGRPPYWAEHRLSLSLSGV